MSVGKSAEREKVIAFCEAYAPHFIAAWRAKALAVANAADLKGKTVGVNRGTLEDTSVTDAAPSGTDIQRFNDYNGVISAFLTGQVQLIVVGNEVGAAVLAKHAANEPERKFDLLDSPSNIALKKGEPALQTKVNEVIAGMKKDGSLNDISKKWLLLPLPDKLLTAAWPVSSTLARRASMPARFSRVRRRRRV